jgi:uncharacterized protein
MDKVMKKDSPIRQRTSTTRPWYTHRWPWLLMLGPFIVVLAGAYTSWLAISGQDALVVDDYYKQGKAINQDLRRDRLASSMKLATELHYDAAIGKLVGTLSSRNKPLSGRINIQLVHSTLPGKDVQLSAQVDQDGHFAIGLPMLDMARWQIVIENEQREWRLNGIWNWPQQRQIAITAEAVAG